jgi:predicted AlkP superfamily phosphohydrolase/phosphomutase
MVVVTLALDGFDENLFKLEEFGHTRDLFRNSPSSSLQSTLPALTPSAFVSMQTGKDVGKHGVSGFLRFDGTSARPYTGADIKDKTFYEILSEQGKKCFLLSMPYSYPARIHGDVVFDWLSIGKGHSHDCVYPSTLFESYPELYDYEIFPNAGDGVADYIQNIKKSSEALDRTIRHVISSKRYDYNFFLIRATDWIQHSLLSQIMSGDKSTKVRIAREAFSIIDKTVHYVAQNIRGNDSLIIMSDHGFTTYKHRFYINDWLKENGYLATSNKTTDSLEKTKYPFLLDNPVNPTDASHAHVPGFVSKMVREHYTLMRAAGFFRGKLERMLNTRFVLSQPIDIEKSLAFAVEESAGSIYLNKKTLSEDQALDLKKELLSKLSSIREIETFDSRALYGPSVASTVPDIYLTSSKYWIRRGLAGTIFSDIYQDHHRRQGILVLTGEAFEKSPANPTMMDIAPTILHILNSPVPDDMEGRVLYESLKSTSEEAKRPVKYVQSAKSTVREEVLSGAEQQIIEERLKSLGYM